VTVESCVARFGRDRGGRAPLVTTAARVDLVTASGADTDISKSEVPRICADLDTEVGAFRDRSLSATY
jgi:transposase-like protein